MSDRIKILIVEDHVLIRRGMAALLRRVGHEVVEAATVAEGIAQLHGQAVALLDMNLPDGQGTDVLAQIRKQNHPTRVAFVSAEYNLESSRFLLTPTDAMFTKPIDFNAVLDWIEQTPNAI